MQKTREEQLALLRLYFSQGLGKNYQRILLEHFGSALQAINNPWKGLEVPLKFESKPHQEVIVQKAVEELDWLEKNHCEVVSILDDHYPPLLKNIHGAPAIFFSRGNFKDWENRIPIAFVGTRRATDYGRQVVDKLISEMADYPFVIVSGFALGLDSFAHEAALRAGIPTVGVLGTGLQYIYPKENETLFYKMLETGSFITEYPRDSLPHPGHFPDRNRLISGISQAVILIETPEKSGALITAEFALEQGREVMAVPGSVFSPLNKGCHQVLQQGAKLVGSLKDILDELGLLDRSEEKELQDQVIKVELDEVEKNLFSNISHEPLHIDKITEISNLAPSSVSGSLTSLILKGLIRELPGKYFVKN